MKSHVVSAYVLLLCIFGYAASAAEYKYIHKQHVSSASQIINQAINVSAGQVFDRLATFTDTFGPRLSGSKQLEASIDYLLDQMKKEGLSNVHGENVQVPYWTRGKEYAKMLSPQTNKTLNMLGLGTSVGTTQDVNSTSFTPLIADAVVVSSFDELDNISSTVKGKIVVYNQYCNWTAEPISCYGSSVGYRVSGASHAAQYGAVAALIRSVAAFSINSPHTGTQAYKSGVPKIPAACITIEDAEMMQRMQNRGQNISIELYMEATNHDERTSRNIVAEIPGSKYPEEVVIVSGHIDSWDVGQGAMDDGGGAFISWQALSLLHQLGLQAKRTVRLVMWTCEEFGGVGSSQYFDYHKKNISNFDFVMESDLGVFHPQGIQYQAQNSSVEPILSEIMSLLKPIDSSTLVSGGGGEDIDPWETHGVPGASLLSENEKYFWFHHSNGDTMSVLNSDDMDLASAVWAVVAFTVADLDEMLPRNWTAMTT